MPFTFHPVRENTYCMSKTLIPGIRHLRQSLRETFIPFHLAYIKIRALLQKVFDRLFIFFRGERTGRVQDHAARTQHLCSLRDDTPLDLRKIIRTVLFPCTDHFPVFAEHSLAGAGGVNQDLVKIFCKIRNQFSRLLAQDEDITDSHKFNIFQETFCAGSAQVISCQDAGTV